ncbi:unnamed protein product [Urochloa humidicola]
MRVAAAAVPPPLARCSPCSTARAAAGGPLPPRLALPSLPPTSVCACIVVLPPRRQRTDGRSVARRHLSLSGGLELGRWISGSSFCCCARRGEGIGRRMFYGPGGPYALFAGKDASRALAKMSFEPQDLTGDISGLGPFELDALQDWEYKFMSKYVKVGTVKKTIPVEDGNTASTAAETSETATEAPATEEKPREVAAEEVKEKEEEKEAAAEEGPKES